MSVMIFAWSLLGYRFILRSPLQESNKHGAEPVVHNRVIDLLVNFPTNDERGTRNVKVYPFSDISTCGAL